MIKNLLQGEPRLRFYRNKKEETIQQLLPQQATETTWCIFLPSISLFVCFLLPFLFFLLFLFFPHFLFSFSSSFSSDSFSIPLRDKEPIPTKDNVVHVMATF